MAKQQDGYLSAKESRRISKENRRITDQYEKQRKRKNVPESEYLTQMKNPENAVEFDNLHTYFFTDTGVVKSVDGVSFEVPVGKTVGVVGESGCGKSVTSLSLMQLLQRHTDIPFETEFLVMDPGYNSENRRIIEDNARALNIPINIFESDIFKSVYNVKKSPCYLCARMRRGYLYKFAQELGCNKIALGHHYDDVIETILMGMLHGAQIQTMMPKLHSTNYPGMELIRPLYLVREDDIKAWRDYNGLHFIQCACKFTDTCTTCNDGQNHSKRQETKELIRELKKSNPDVEKCIFSSVENVNIDTVLAYKKDGIKHSFLDEYDNK